VTKHFTEEYGAEISLVFDQFAHDFICPARTLTSIPVRHYLFFDRMQQYCCTYHSSSSELFYIGIWQCHWHMLPDGLGLRFLLSLSLIFSGHRGPSHVDILV